MGEYYLLWDIIGSYDNGKITSNQCFDRLEEFLMKRDPFLIPQIEKLYEPFDQELITAHEYCEDLVNLVYEKNLLLDKSA
jgi:hypothetical protein